VGAGILLDVAAKPDRWSRWLLERRDAGSERQRVVALDRLGRVRDRVLDAAEPLDGATVLDVGAGDGLIGLGALDRVGAGGAVIFADISPALLEQCRRAAKELGALDRTRFIQAKAEDLGRSARRLRRRRYYALGAHLRRRQGKGVRSVRARSAARWASVAV